MLVIFSDKAHQICIDLCIVPYSTVYFHFVCGVLEKIHASLCNEFC